MYKRISKYYPGCDGTPLAVDLYLPETTERVPVIFQISNGERRLTDTGHPFAKQQMAEQERQINFFIDHGYAYARVAPRGNGASFGFSEGFWSRIDGKDFAAIIDQVASEAWCNGNAGMYGGSNVGASQHLAASYQPKHLKCIIPCDCSADFYYQNYPNGVSIIGEGMNNRPKMPPMLGIPVDDDPAPDYPMAHKAMEEHVNNMGFLEQYLPNMHRDSVNHKIGYAPGLEIPSWEKMDVFRHGHVAPYLYGAWFDPGCTNAIFAYKSWGGRLMLGPWRHVEVTRPGCPFPQGDIDWLGDHLAFFDAKLKGIDNSYESSPPVTYYTVGDEDPWHFSADFPLDSQTNPQLKLTADGKLLDTEIVPAGTRDYKVRNDITIFDSMGRLNRLVEKDLREEDAKCVCFTTEPLEGDLELTGFPVVELYATSTYKDGIFLAVLEEITPDGVSHLVTDGMIRGRSAKLARNNATDPFGVPYHTSLSKDDVELSDTVPTLLAFHLEATSRVFHKGSRLQLAVYCGGNGFNQPEGMPEDVTVTFHFGGEHNALLRLPVIAPNVTKFVGEDATVYAFKRAVYIRKDGRWSAFPCQQVYPDGDTLKFVTDAFTAVRKTENEVMTLTIEGEHAFTGSGTIPQRMTFREQSTEILKTVDPFFRSMQRRRQQIHPQYRNLYVATVPVAKEQPGQMNPQPVSTFDLFIDLALPEGDGPFPCIVNVHGFGGSHHQFEDISTDLLARGYAVASIDYRLMPPNVWPASDIDSKGCFRYLKAHAKELKLDPNRFGTIGGSMGGQITTAIAACNGDRAYEGTIGGNTDYDSSIKAAVSLFAPTNFFTFGDDCAEVWPGRPDKVANADGPYAPLASELGYVGPGKGMGDVKAHLFDSDPKYQALIEMAKDASSVYHVTEKSAPVCLVHGIFDCGIQVPLGQSMELFKALTRKGVKSLVLLNNNGPFGEDPEIRQAMIDFLCNRV